MTHSKNKAGAPSDDALEAFLDRASQALQEEAKPEEDIARPSAAPSHRRLRLIVSPDRMEAYLEAIFPGTTATEVRDALKQEGIVRGIQEAHLKQSLAQATRTGRRVKEVLAARGTPAVYRKRKVASYPFLAGRTNPETGEALHLASAALREIAEVMARSVIDRIRGYGHPVLAAAPKDVLMKVQGEDEIEPGWDVFGKVVRTVQDSEPGPLKAGDGVQEQPDGSLCADRFGYVSVISRYLSVLSPIWVSPDGMEAYFVNPPQLGAPQAPDAAEVIGQLEDQGICFGIDQNVIRQMCRDLRRGNLRESCVRIAQGRRPGLGKGEISFSFEPIPPARFEAVRKALRAFELQHVTECETAAPVVHAGVVLAEQLEEDSTKSVGTNLFGEPVAPPEEAQEKTVYKAGANVRRETREGRICYISEIYGYAGLLDNQVTVISPLWIAPDKMAAYFILPPNQENPIRPTPEEFQALLAQARVRHGVDPAAIETICTTRPASGQPHTRAIRVAQGMPPEAGQDGIVELLFKQMPDPGQMLSGDKIDFRERNAVPNVQPGQRLARRTFPTPGKPGMDIRGRMLPPAKHTRELLYTGPNVVSKEEAGEVHFYATGAGCPRVVKDTLSVVQLLRHRGDVNYDIGNIRFDGSIEIEGTVKPRFQVEASGDIYVGGSVEQRAQIKAGGKIVVRGGIIGARIETAGSLYAKFIQDAEVEVGEDLVVRNYVQDAHVQVGQSATIQGDEGGSRHLCLLGGVLQAGWTVSAASVGSQQGRQTHVIAGRDARLETRLARYQKGLEYCKIRSRRLMHTLQHATGGKARKEDLAAAIQCASKKRQQFLIGLLVELQELGQLNLSLEHHLAELEEQRRETARRAQVRVTGSAFSKVTLQIADLRRVLDQDIQAVAFCLDPTKDRILCSPLS